MKKDMLRLVIQKIMELPIEMLGTLYDLLKKLLSEDEWHVELKKFLRKEKSWAVTVEIIKKTVQDKFFKLISAGEELILDATDGAEIIAEAEDLFTAGIDSGFRSWNADEYAESTAEIQVDVYELVNDANFSRMFGSLGDVSKLCLTQAQIIGFVKKHRQLLRGDGCTTFFIFKSYDQFFVAFVIVSSDGGFNVYVSRFGDSHDWHAESCHRVVVPRLA